MFSQELADKVSTKESMKALRDDVKFRLTDIGNGMTELKALTTQSGLVILVMSCLGNENDWKVEQILKLLKC